MAEDLPKVGELMPAIVRALKRLGGEGALPEIEEGVVRDLRITPQQMAVAHQEGKQRSELDYRMAWARTKLRKRGTIDRVDKGIWRVSSDEEGG